MKLIEGVNDLATLFPDIAAQWDNEKNGPLHPSDVSPGSEKKIWWRCSLDHSWQTYVFRRTEGHGCPYCANAKIWPGFNDLAARYPLIAAQWDTTRNGDASPDKIAPFSHRKIWWRCNLGHSWAAAVSERVQGEGCPYCCGNKVLAGFNDLETTHPHIASSWDLEKNGGLTPQQVSKGSSKMIWWVCSLGHSWKAPVYSRAAGTSCPYCSSQKLWPGFNDLETLNPALAAEWDTEKNMPLTPQQVMPNSHKKVWWRCSIGHSWQAVVASRNNGTNCPVCKNRAILPGENDLATASPSLAAEWNYDRNENVTPNTVSPNAHRKVWWIDSLGHEWQATVANRSTGTGCPVCSGRQVLMGFNDLASKNPALATEWDVGKNGDLRPTDVTANSQRRVWWLCDLGHSWRTPVSERNKRQTNCPYCANRMPLPGETDFATNNPDLMREWDFEKNQGVDPSRLTKQARKAVWWKCEYGHSWRAEIYNRVHGTNCPYCFYKRDKHRTVPGVNDLKAENPELAEQWDIQRNGDLSPEQVTPFSNRSVWWKCENGHHWTASPSERMSGHACPYCDGKTPPRMRLV